jgi:uncharacterized damage-inducible protein DinB
MKETPQQYTRRILGYLGNKNPLATQRATHGRLRGLLKRLSRQQLKKRPAPGKWSITEILAHLADVELVAGYRLRMILSRNATPIQAFDQDLWAQSGNYAGQDPAASLEVFRLLRERNLKLLRSVSRQRWSNYGMHAERGKETIARVVAMLAGHDLNHLGQIQRIAASFRRR